MLCSDELREIEFLGDTQKVEGRGLIINFKACEGTNCKPQEEINQFLEENTLLLVLNNQIYQPEVYTEEAIKTSAEVRYENMRPKGSTSNRHFQITENRLTSQESFLPSVEEPERVFYSIPEKSTAFTRIAKPGNTSTQKVYE